MTEVTEELADNMKRVLFDTFLSQYQQMTGFINRLPVSPQLKQIIIKHFDDGFLWTNEAFTMITFVAPPAPVSPTAAALGTDAKLDVHPDIHLVEENAAVA